MHYTSAIYMNMVLQKSTAAICDHLSHNQALFEGLLGLLVKISAFILLMLPVHKVY